MEWIKQFDAQTVKKAKGRYRLLIVDGHNSHYMYEFLNYARMNKIIVLCYPSHTTHILQGLDVVLFATVKCHLGDERDNWELKTGEQINKTNFLGIYGHAHLRALTPGNIKAAFRKTGVWPFNPSVVSEAMIAPSKETSCEAYLPVAPSSPVLVLAKMLCKLAISGVQDEGGDGEADAEDNVVVVVEENEGEAETDEGNDGDDRANEGPNHHKGNDSDEAATIKKAISKLAEGSMACLVSTGPMSSSSRLEPNIMAPIPPCHPDEALNLKPRTTNERLLISAL